MNILITSVGRQVFLVNAFKEALNGKGKVCVADYDGKAKAFSVADVSFVVPAFTSDEYIPELIKICKENKINLLLSLNVDDIICIKKHEELFRRVDCFVLGAEHDMIVKSNDKYELPIMSQELGLPAAKTWLFDESFTPELIDNYPIIAKPRYGKGARGNVVINSVSELKDFMGSIDSYVPYVFQEMIVGEEYGFDIINDLEGNFFRILGRRKIIQKGGESFQAETINPDFWINAAKKWSNKIKYTGTANFDVIFDGEKGYLIDLNLRFSGDYVFSHIAGANTPKIIVDLFLKNNIDALQYWPEFEVKGERIKNSVKRI